MVNANPTQQLRSFNGTKKLFFADQPTNPYFEGKMTQFAEGGTSQQNLGCGK